MYFKSNLKLFYFNIYIYILNSVKMTMEKILLNRVHNYNCVCLNYFLFLTRNIDIYDKPIK